MNKLIDELIVDFKKEKIKSDNLFESFFIFCNIFLKKSKDDKYNEGTLNILKYILANKDIISLKLIQN
tara:strand:+ start:782 stop:985 length:204 start_codon:yes stop_codon:yes gene_type:complete